MPVIFVLSMVLNIRGNSEGLGEIHSQKKLFSVPPIHPTAPFRSTQVCFHSPQLYHTEAHKHGGKMGSHGHARSPYTYEHRDVFPCAGRVVYAQHMLTCSRERPSRLVKGPQALISQEDQVLYGAGTMRCWDSLVAWSCGIATWISCGMSCRPLWAASCKPTPTAVAWDFLLHRWYLVWGSGDTLHRWSVPPGWDVHAKGNSQVPGLLVYQGSVSSNGGLSKHSCVTHSWKL